MNIYDTIQAEFKIKPISAPRQVQSDRWKERPCVMQYRAYRDALTLQANKQKFNLPEVLRIRFDIEVTESWSKKKKDSLMFKPHQQKPDIDNLCKAFMDALSDSDQNVWRIEAEKFWSFENKITVYKPCTL